MRKVISLIIHMQLICFILPAQVSVNHLLCENKTNPLGIDIMQPRFSWQLISDKRDVLQTAYEIRVSDGLSTLNNDKNLLWSTGKISSDQSVHVPYAGAALQSGKKYYWQVRVWDNLKNLSSWSKPSFWQMGLLNSSDWHAKWIEPGYVEDSIQRPSPYFRKKFIGIGV